MSPEWSGGKGVPTVPVGSVASHVTLNSPNRDPPLYLQLMMTPPPSLPTLEMSMMVGSSGW